MSSSAERAAVAFDGPASPAHDAVAAAPRTRRPVLPSGRRRHLEDHVDAERPGDGADQQVRAQRRRLRGMGKRRNRIRRKAARLARGPGRSRPASRPPNRPSPPPIAGLPHLRLGRTDRVLEALVPAVLEQRVAGKDAFRAWRLLVTKYGAPAPGPAPRAHAGAPVGRGVATHPVVGVPPGQRRPGPRPHHRRVCAARRLAGAADELARREQARAALTSLPGVGEWTAAEVAQRAWGDADALSVGDYHLANVVGCTLLGHRIDDPEMVELLEPLRPHRHRAVRLLEVSGLARNPALRARRAADPRSCSGCCSRRRGLSRPCRAAGRSRL